MKTIPTHDNVMALECPVCKHQWLGHLQLPMVVDDFVKALKAAAVCPKCGNSSMGKDSVVLLTGAKYREVRARLELDDKERRVKHPAHDDWKGGTYAQS